MNQKSYSRLVLMFVLHVIAMYVLMYAMVDVFGHALPNTNQLYMAVLMATPMVLFELLLMKSMYQNRDLNFLVLVIAVGLFIGSFFFIRSQTAIGDVQLLKSMIPHHAGAVLMCKQASLEDEQVRQLCTNIITSQEAEITWMEQKIESLGG